jgi:hypothetical protein
MMVLARTFSLSRWDEYRRLLAAACESGYQVVSLEEWVLDRDRDAPQPVFLLRHDVDQDPGSAWRMADVERELGIRSTWYFRWRTAHPAVTRELRRRGGHLGLHYETLTRIALDRGLHSPTAIQGLLGECRIVLRDEIALFARRHGPIRSVCPHGDTRLPGVSNGALLQGEDLTGYGVRFDAKRGLLGRPVAFVVTDRSAANGGWQDGKNPHRALEERATPILCVTHPNNWASGPSLWTDRLLRRLLSAPSASLERRPRLVRAGRDEPFK